MPYNLTINKRGWRKFHQKSVCTIWYVDKTYSTTASTLRRLGLAPEQIPSIAWELIPFSFVVDWFVDIGSWIKACQPKPGCDVLSSSRTTVLTNEYFLEYLTPSIYQGSCQVLSTEPETAYSRQLSRYANPKLTAKPPVNPAMFSIKRRIDALSLIWQNLPKVFRK
jgi:hypothetical protein